MQKKTYDNIEHLFITKTLNKVGLNGTYLNIIKSMYVKPSGNILLHAEKLKAFLLGSGKAPIFDDDLGTML